MTLAGKVQIFGCPTYRKFLQEVSSNILKIDCTNRSDVFTKRCCCQVFTHNKHWAWKRCQYQTNDYTVVAHWSYVFCGCRCIQRQWSILNSRFRDLSFNNFSDSRNFKLCSTWLELNFFFSQRKLSSQISCREYYLRLTKLTYSYLLHKSGCSVSHSPATLFPQRICIELYLKILLSNLRFILYNKNTPLTFSNGITFFIEKICIDKIALGKTPSGKFITFTIFSREII